MEETASICSPCRMWSSLLRYIGGDTALGENANGGTGATPLDRRCEKRDKECSQAKVFLNLVFEAPRMSVIMTYRWWGRMRRPRKAGKRRGGFAPTAAASTGSHPATGAGSSSTTLNTPSASASSAAIVALAASAIWMNDQPPPYRLSETCAGLPAR